MSVQLISLSALSADIGLSAGSNRYAPATTALTVTVIIH